MEEVTSIDGLTNADPSKSVLVIGNAPRHRKVVGSLGSYKRKSTNTGIFERNPAHALLGHEGGEIFVTNYTPLRVALTDAVFRRLVKGELRFATTEEVKAAEAERAEQSRRAEESIKEQARAQFIQTTGGNDGFDAAWPGMRQRLFGNRAA